MGAQRLLSRLVLPSLASAIALTARSPESTLLDSADLDGTAGRCRHGLAVFHLASEVNSMKALRLALVLATLAILAAPAVAQLIWIVDDAADPLPITGTLTLRQAITNANAMPGIPHTILFQIPGLGIHKIALTSPMPAITVGSVWINGYSQPGSSPGMQPPGTATILIELDGQFAGPCHGLVLQSSQNRIEGLAIMNFLWDGIRIQGTAPPGTQSNDIYANFVGTDATGTLSAGNGSGLGNIWAGIDILCTPGPLTFCQANMVHENLVSENYRCGIQISSCPPSDCGFNNVMMNWIGTDRGGFAQFGNLGSGVVLAEGTHDNMVTGNVISANGANGIDLTGNDMTLPPASTIHNHFMGNLVGLAIDGLTPLGNGGRGVSLGIFEIASYFAGFCSENLFQNNQIAFNGLAGMSVWENPATPTNCDGNTFQANLLHDNGGLCIDLDDNGRTFNDPGDLDTGANEDLNYPAITWASWVAGTTYVRGNMEVPAEVHLYRAQVDASGEWEAAQWFGSVWPSAQGDWAMAVAGLSPGDVLTAHAIDWLCGTYGNSSELAAPFTVVNGTGVTEQPLPSRLGLTLSGANPFRGETAFTCALPAVGNARLVLFDCAGRRVRTLLDRQVAAGALPIAWDGRDDAGRELPAGVYLARLSANGEQVSSRAVKLR